MAMAKQMALVLLALFALSGGVALAQEAYPNRPISIVVPFPPGGVADLTARPVAVALEKTLRNPVGVINKTGAAGAVGMQFVAASKPDGYTLLLALSSISIIPEADKLFGRAPAFTVDQFEPIALISADPTVLVVRAESPWKTAQEFIDGRPQAARSDHVQLVGGLRDAAHGHGAAAAGGGDQAPPRPLSGRGPGRHRAARWPRRRPGLGAVRGAPAHQGRQAARARRLGRSARRCASRGAHVQGAGLSGRPSSTSGPGSSRRGARPSRCWPGCGSRCGPWSAIPTSRRPWPSWRRRSPSSRAPSSASSSTPTPGGWPTACAGWGRSRRSERLTRPGLWTDARHRPIERAARMEELTSVCLRPSPRRRYPAGALASRSARERSIDRAAIPSRARRFSPRNQVFLARGTGTRSAGGGAQASPKPCPRTKGPKLWRSGTEYCRALSSDQP